MKTMRKISGLSGAVAVTAAMVAGFSAEAGAGERMTNDRLPQVVVSYADLNLDTDAGALALYRRISNAARRVCADHGSRDVQQMRAVRACREQAITRAISDVGNEKLAAVHTVRGRVG